MFKYIVNKTLLNGSVCICKCFYEQLLSFLQGNISLFSSLPDALQDVDFIFEAVPDKLEIKRPLFHGKICLDCPLNLSPTSNLH